MGGGRQSQAYDPGRRKTHLFHGCLRLNQRRPTSDGRTIDFRARPTYPRIWTYRREGLMTLASLLDTRRYLGDLEAMALIRAADISQQAAGIGSPEHASGFPANK